MKARLFGLLTAADYHWPEDLDFVRIPKSAVKELNPILAVDVTGKIKDWGAELLGLTPEEKQRAEAALQAHAQAVSQLAANRAYETNSLPASLATHWAGKPYKSIWVPPLGADAQSLMAGLLAQVGDALGEERAQLLLGDCRRRQRRLLPMGRSRGRLVPRHTVYRLRQSRSAGWPGVWPIRGRQRRQRAIPEPACNYAFPPARGDLQPVL